MPQVPTQDTEPNSFVLHLTTAQLTVLVKSAVNAALKDHNGLIELPTPPPELLTREQVRKMLGVSNPTMISWASSGVLPAIRYGRTVRYNRHEVEKAMQSAKSRRGGKV